MKKWNLLNYSKSVFKELLLKNVQSSFAKVLASREFFASLVLSGNFEDNGFTKDLNLIDIDKAADRIKFAVNNKEKICIYGDYDADGVCATSVLYLYLKRRGADVFYYIPLRNEEGYGLNFGAIDKIKSKGAKLIITVDNGVTAIKEIDYATSINLDVVVTDHHEVLNVLPEAVAVVDPRRKDCPSKFKNLAGVGVVFYLICFMEDGFTHVCDLLKFYSELVTIGTVGDVVPLISKNREFLAAGLSNINNNYLSVGLKALMALSGGKAVGKKINALNMAFNIVPKINAAGRLSKASLAVELLTTEDGDLAKDLAKKLNAQNNKRKEIEKNIFAEIEQELLLKPEVVRQKIIIVYGKGWHPGVIGIVSARLLEKYGKPVIVITTLDGETARGSARSVAGFSIYDAISVCSSYLLKFGGHPLAAGFDLKVSDIERFKNDILNYAEKVGVPFFCLNIDAELEPFELNKELAKNLALLEPFGKDNEKPVFKISRVVLKKVMLIGNKKHLKLFFLGKNGENFTVLNFFKDIDNFYYKEGDILDLAVNLEENIYNGISSVTVILVDAKFSETDDDYMLSQKSIYEDLMLGKYEVLKLLKKEDIVPKREEFAVVYRYIKSLKKLEIHGDINVFYLKMNNKTISFSKFLIILSIFCELGLLSFFIDADEFKICFKNCKNKVDLESSKLLFKISA